MNRRFGGNRSAPLVALRTSFRIICGLWGARSEGHHEHRSEDAPRKGRTEHNPQVSNRLHGVFVVRAVPGSAHDSGAKGARWVDGAAVNREKEKVRQEHGEADGDARVVPAGAIAAHGRLPHHEAEQRREDKLPEERLVVAESGVDHVGSQVRGHILRAREDSPEKEGSKDASAGLRKQVCEALWPVCVCVCVFEGSLGGSWEI